MDVIGAVIGAIVLWFGIACLATWAVMVGVGNIHAWWTVIPTMGFWDAFWVTVWFAVPLAVYSNTNNSSN